MPREVALKSRVISAKRIPNKIPDFRRLWVRLCENGRRSGTSSLSTVKSCDCLVVIKLGLPSQDTAKRGPFKNSPVLEETRGLEKVGNKAF